MPNKKSEKTDHEKKARQEKVTIQPRRNPNHYNPRATRWMWIGVIGVTSIIVLLWGYALQTRISFFNWSNSPEAHLITATKANWQSIMTKSPNDVSKETVKRNLKY